MGWVLPMGIFSMALKLVLSGLNLYLQRYETDSNDSPLTLQAWLLKGGGRNAGVASTTAKGLSDWYSWVQVHSSKGFWRTLCPCFLRSFMSLQPCIPHAFTHVSTCIMRVVCIHAWRICVVFCYLDIADACRCALLNVIADAPEHAAGRGTVGWDAWSSVTKYGRRILSW